MGRLEDEGPFWSIEELSDWSYPTWSPGLDERLTESEARKEWGVCLQAGVPYLPFAPLLPRKSWLARAFEDSNRDLPQPWKYPQGEQPHQLRRETEAWEARRARDLERRCEWCGNTEALALHHPNGKPHYRKLWTNVLNYMTVEALLVGVEEVDVRRTVLGPWDDLIHEAFDGLDRRWCPECGRVADRRKTKTPPWRCNGRGCTNTFADEEAIAQPGAVFEALKEAWGTLLGKIAFRATPALLDWYEEYVEQEVTHYIEEAEVVTLCRGCHLAAGEGKVLCDSCGESYHKPNWDRCFNCAKAEADLKECPRCGNHRDAEGFDDGVCSLCAQSWGPIADPAP